MKFIKKKKKEKKKQAATFKIDSVENNKTTSLRLCNFPLEKEKGGGDS